MNDREKELHDRIQKDAAILIAEKLVGPKPKPGRVEEVTNDILRVSRGEAKPATKKPTATPKTRT